MKSRHAGVIGVTMGAVLVLAAYAATHLAGSGSPAGVWLMISGVSILMGAAFLLPVNGWGRWGVALGVTALLLTAFAATFTSAPDHSGGRLLGGFPFRVGLIVYGVAIFPALILPLLHARQFDSSGLDPDSLRSFRDECRRLRGEP